MAQHEHEALRRLAGRWRELAERPVMAERRRAWTALKDLRAERPMVLFETATLEDYVGPEELACADPLLREVELAMRRKVRHVVEVGDDTVLEPRYAVDWQKPFEDYGVPLVVTSATDSSGASHGYTYDHPIRTPADVDRLRPRRWAVDRAATLRDVERLTAIFGDLLPTVIRGASFVYAGLTSDAFRLIGNDNLLSWPYDAPEALHRLMAYLRDDRLAYYRWMAAEGLLDLNVDSAYIGSGSPGYVSCLPQPGYAGTARPADLWIWIESQETTMFSPAMFAEFFLPYMAEAARPFGLVYYGCCEPVHDRWAHIRAAIPHVRAVSVSPWSDLQQVAAQCGREVVFSRKPRPAPMSGPAPDWDALRDDIDATLAAARDCHLEIIFRDVYRIHGDRPRLRQWVELVRARAEKAMTE